MDHSQPASMQDVAKAASVSPQTVSRVANGSNAVRPETRQRVEAAMAKLGYRPNYAARALKRGIIRNEPYFKLCVVNRSPAGVGQRQQHEKYVMFGIVSASQKDTRQRIHNVISDDCRHCASP